MSLPKEVKSVPSSQSRFWKIAKILALSTGILAWLTGVIWVLASLYYTWEHNPLPSDEKMIANFKANRADFVEAVRRYRATPRPRGKDSSLWFLEGDTLEVYKRAGIGNIDYSYGDWLPNPYSLETARILKKRQDELWDDTRPLEINPFEIHHKYGSLRIYPASTPRIDHPLQYDGRGYTSVTIRFGVIWKHYHFFPEAPRIENGELLGPIDHKGQYSFRFRVFPSLNRFPPSWKDPRPGCAFRPIEPQWFLSLCNGH